MRRIRIYQRKRNMYAPQRILIDSLAVDTKCSSCEGAGRVFKTIRQGNTLYQTQAGKLSTLNFSNIVLVCDTCNGKCYVIPDADKCPKCNGEKVVKDSKIFTLDIEKGAKFGDTITFYGEADQTPGVVTGDIIFHLRQKKDNTPFRREGNDLYIQQDIQVCNLNVESLTNLVDRSSHWI